MTPTITFENRDCMEAMKEFPDKFFELAIVDPPYGGGFTEGGGCQGWFSKYHQDVANNTHTHTHTHNEQSFRGSIREVQEATGRVVHRAEYGGGTRKDYRRDKGDNEGKKIIAWDVAPGEEYFDELFRISRNQIIWGGNYFDLPPTRCFVIWRKTNIPIKGFTMAPCEYAWTSFNRNALVIEAGSQGTKGDERWHPCRKPISVYEELLDRFASPGDKIIDTHVGSGTSLIACYNRGFDAWGYEVDATYYKLAKADIEAVQAQIRMDL